MNCTEARDAMLVAEFDDLSGRGEPTLAEHMEACDECRATATRMIHELGALAAAVRARRHPSQRATVVGRIALVAALPIAAGLFVALRLATTASGPSSERLNAGASATPSPVASTGVTVDVSPGQQATVIKTRDPKITVVWIEQRGGL